MRSKMAFALTFLTLLLYAFSSNSFPLSTTSRWIVDQDSGDRVKLACVNWAGHLHAMIPEGLNKKPVKAIVSDISATMGFNCVRLTWATYMYTRQPNVTVLQSLNQWNLTMAREGIEKNNPQLLGMTVVDVQNAVVEELREQKIMVVLDNHVSLPQWCCGSDDGNGFFGDRFFDPDEWVRGLVTVAQHYKGNPAVVGMSMRNELRGPRQNPNDWYKYMQQAGVAIHNENPDILVIFSGLSYDTDLTFLKNRPLTIDLDKKLVFEAHWYSFGQPDDSWLFKTNEYCANVTNGFMSNSGFVFADKKNPIPLFLSEFGIDQTGGNEVENRYFSCILASLAGNDIDWALWQLAGSYMLREGNLDMEDVFGMYDFNWDKLRNSTMLERLHFIQTKIQDPTKPEEATSYVIYHPQSGQCVKASGDTIVLSNCQKASRWIHKQDGDSIQLTDTSKCLTVAGEGLPPTLTDNHANCSSSQSSWNVASSSKLHLVAKDDQGKGLCLEGDSCTSKILTKKCLCLGDDLRDVSRCEENPEKQWFKLIPTNV